MPGISTYPYLYSSLFALLIVLVLAVLLPRHRKGILLGGLLGAPFGMLSFEFVPDYWNPEFAVPVYLGGHFFFGLADIVFSFATGALAWLFLVHRTNGSISWQIPAQRIFLRFLMYGVPGILIARALKMTVLPELPMVATFIGIAIMSVLYFRAKPWAVILAVQASLRFTAVYVVFLLAIIWLMPSSLAYWNTPHHLSFQILGLPFFEVAWAAVYSLVFPMFQMTVIDAKWQPEHARLGEVRRSTT